MSMMVKLYVCVLPQLKNWRKIDSKILAAKIILWSVWLASEFKQK